MTDSTDTSTDSTKPWGDDDNFDAARAWTLIQNLRNDKAGLTESLSSAKAELAEAVKAREAAESDAKSARGDLSKHKRDQILSEFDIDEDDASEFLPEDLSLDELRRKAERLSRRKGSEESSADDQSASDAEGDADSGDSDGEEKETEEEQPKTAAPRRPRMKPSTGAGSAPDTFDADAIAKSYLATRR